MQYDPCSFDQGYVWQEETLSQYTIKPFLWMFLGLTAYDTQMIRRYYDFYCDQPDTLKKASIFSALQLYLDFINLFLHLLRFLVRSKKN